MPFLQMHLFLSIERSISNKKTIGQALGDPPSWLKTSTNMSSGGIKWTAMKGGWVAQSDWYRWMGDPDWYRWMGGPVRLV